ncbi:MAG: response regulator [Myxococcaceae bacterium]
MTAPRGAEDHAQAAKQHLLLVDGDAKSLRVMEVSLKKAGYAVTTAIHGRDALEKVQISAPDVVVSDTKMPEMDGFELCRALKNDARTKQIPFVFLTNQKSVEFKVKGLELGADDYLTKPIYIKEIVARLSMLLQKVEKDRVDRTKETKGGFSGSLVDMGVVDLVQTFEIGRKTGVLSLTSPRGAGAMFFREGRVIDAEWGQANGEAAFYRILNIPEGTFELQFVPVDRAGQIETSTQGLLMEGMRRIDEWGRIIEQLPPLDAYFEIDDEQLAERLSEIPDEVNGILRLFDGTRSLQRAVEDSSFDDLAALGIVSKLYFEGLIREVAQPPSDEATVVISVPAAAPATPPGPRLADRVPERAPERAVVESPVEIVGTAEDVTTDPAFVLPPPRPPAASVSPRPSEPPAFPMPAPRVPLVAEPPRAVSVPPALAPLAPPPPPEPLSVPPELLPMRSASPARVQVDVTPLRVEASGAISPIERAKRKLLEEWSRVEADEPARPSLFSSEQSNWSPARTSSSVEVAAVAPPAPLEEAPLALTPAPLLALPALPVAEAEVARPVEGSPSPETSRAHSPEASRVPLATARVPTGTVIGRLSPALPQPVAVPRRMSAAKPETEHRSPWAGPVFIAALVVASVLAFLAGVRKGAGPSETPRRSPPLPSQSRSPAPAPSAPTPVPAQPPVSPAPSVAVTPTPPSPSAVTAPKPTPEPKPDTKPSEPPRQTPEAVLPAPPLTPAQPATPVTPPAVVIPPDAAPPEATQSAMPTPKMSPQPRSESDVQFGRALAMGRRAVSSDNFKTAAFHFRRALTLKPESSEAKAGLGIALVGTAATQSDYREGARMLEEGLRTQDRNAMAWLSLGMAYQFTSQRPKARKAYERYLALEPNGVAAGEVRALLKELND